MELEQKIIQYLCDVVCADVAEIAQEVPCSEHTILCILRSHPHVFWCSKDGMWFAVGAAIMGKE